MSEKTDKEKKEDHFKCKNCETEFSGNYCPECGQTVKNFDKPFRFFIVDFMGNIFAFDTRLWRTLKAILFKPGFMTRDFMAGKRVRYMPPFRFYIFVSFIFFLLLSVQTKRQIEENQLSIDTDTVQTKGINFSINGDKKETDSNAVFVDNETNTKKTINLDEFTKNLEKKIREEEAIKDSLNKADLKTEDTEQDDEIVDIIKILKYPEIYVERLLKYSSWSLFLLMPVFAALLLLFFRKSYKFYIAHLIFALNQHAFLFVLLILMIVVKMIFPEKEIKPENYLILLSPVFLFTGAKILYKRGWIRTFFSLLLIVFLYFLILIPAILTIAIFAFTGV